MRLRKRLSRTGVPGSLALPFLAALLVSVPATPARDAQVATAAPVDAVAWNTVAASGRVEARPNLGAEPVWQKVKRGDELLPSTLVRTGHRGRVTLTRRASLLILDPESQVELPASARPGMETSVIQRSGSVLYDVDSRENPHFEVVTPYLVAGVKGTEFLVTVNEDYTSVSVQHGLVEVTNPDTGERQRVGPGESLFRERDRFEMDLVGDVERRARAEVGKESKRLARMTTEKSAAQLSDDPGAGTRSRKKSGNSFEPEFAWIGNGTGSGAHAGHGAGKSVEEPSFGDDTNSETDSYFDDDALICDPTLTDCRRDDDSNDDGDDDTNPGTGKPIDPVTQSPVLGGPDPEGTPPVTDPGKAQIPADSDPSEALLMLLEEQSDRQEQMEQESEKMEIKSRTRRRGHVSRTD